MLKTLSSVAFGSLLLFPIISEAQPVPSNWYVRVEPFYARLTDTLLTNAMFAVKVPDTVILGDFKEQYFNETDPKWGATIAVGFDTCRTACKSYGVTLAYTFLNLKNSRSLDNDSLDHAGLPVLAPAEFIDITDEASAKFSHAATHFKQDYDTVDLLAQKNVKAAGCSNLTLFTGIRYFHLHEKLDNHYSFSGLVRTSDGPTGPAVSVTNVYNINFSNHVDTAGPRLGAALFYPLGCNFGITGDVAGSLLYGQSKSRFRTSYDLTGNSVLGAPTSLTSRNSHSETAHFIPAFSAHFGLAYRALLRCSDLTFEAGYRGEKYFNATNDVAYQQLVAGDDINSKCNYQDIDLSGPYLSFTWRSRV